MNLKTESSDNTIICLLAGRLDTIASQELEPEIEALEPGEKGLVFDFSNVEYISSTFLRICLKSFKVLGSERFWITNPSPDIKKVFKIAGLEKLVRS